MSHVYAELVKIQNVNYVRVVVKPDNRMFLFDVDGKQLYERQKLRMTYKKLFSNFAGEQKC